MDNIQVNYSTKTISINNKRLDFDEKQFEMVLYLIEKSPSQISYKDIYQEIWKEDKNNDFFNKKSVQDEISKIRKIAPEFEQFIQNAYGTGYRISFPNPQNETKQNIQNIQTKTDSLFTESLSVLFNASYPDKTGTNTGNKKVLFTRYTLFALVKYFFPDEEDVLLVLGDDQKSPEQITKELLSTKVKSNELEIFKNRIYFEWEISKSGKKSGLITANIKNASPLQNLTTKNYKHTLDSLLSAYNNLPKEFHSNYSSMLKKEINTTVSLFVLAAAYKNLFCQNEDTRSELLTICDNLIKTHNHHNSFLYALFERNRTSDNQDGNYLFREFSSESHECLRAVDLLKNYFYDNWVTEQKPSYVGNKFLLWANDKNVVYDIVNSGYCYDYKILRGYAEQFNDFFSLRQIFRIRIFKTFNFWNNNEESICYKNHILTFLQMASTDKLYLLVYAKDDSKYNEEVKNFLKFVIENLDKFPKEKWRMVGHGIRKLLPLINGYNPEKPFEKTNQLLSEVNVDWKKECYSTLLSYIEAVNGAKPLQKTAEDSMSFVKTFIDASPEEKSNIILLKKACGCLKNLFNNNNIIFDKNLKIFAIELVTILLDKNIFYETILATHKRFYIFSESLAKRIFDFTITFLYECDYAQQENSTIQNALSVLKISNYNNSQQALEKCYLQMNKIKNNKSFALLNYILEGVSCDCLVQKIISEKNSEEKPFSKITQWLISDKHNREILDDFIYTNDLIYEFIDKLTEAKELVAQALSLSIIHFVKNHDCFFDKTPSSDLFYKEKLLNPIPEVINIDFIHQKAKEHNLSINTVMFHLCKVLRTEPEKTAFVCIEFLSKLYGQVEHMNNNSEHADLKTLELLGKRLVILPVIVSNPVIRNTAKKYCLKMRQFAKSIPQEKKLKIILDIANHDKYPEWFTEIDTLNTDILITEDVLLSELRFKKSSRPASDDLKKEIKENLIPWLNSERLPNDTYTPQLFILALRNNDGSYQIIDGNRVINHFIEESIAYGDFKIKINTVSFSE